MCTHSLAKNSRCRPTQVFLHSSLNLRANCSGIDASRYCNGRQNWTGRKAKLDRCRARSQGRTANRGTRCSVTQDHQISQSEQQKRCERSSVQSARCPNQIFEKQLFIHCTTREARLHTTKWLFTRKSVAMFGHALMYTRQPCSHLTAWSVPLQQLMQQEKRPLPLRGMYGPAWNAQLRA